MRCIKRWSRGTCRKRLKFNDSYYQKWTHCFQCLTRGKRKFPTGIPKWFKAAFTGAGEGTENNAFIFGNNCRWILAVYTGEDGLAFATKALGGQGVISVASHVFGSSMYGFKAAFTGAGEGTENNAFIFGNNCRWILAASGKFPLLVHQKKSKELFAR
jgi:hypothetical protein